MWLRPYKVIVVSAEGGLIEPIPNAISLHQVKRQCSGSLKDYFLKVHHIGRAREGAVSVYIRTNICTTCALPTVEAYLLRTQYYGMLECSWNVAAAVPLMVWCADCV